MEELTALLGNYAFPIVVTLWFMFRTEKVISENTKATQEMSKIIVTYCEKK